jgi:hypothetical protein
MYAVPTQPGVLSRLSLVTSVSALLADDVISVPGRDQLLAADDQVAYITASGLTVVPLAGGPPSSLAPATSLAAHVPGLVFFYGPDLQMISTSGGSTHVFPQGVIEDTTPDHVLVVSGAQRTLVDVPSGATHRLEDGYIHAAVAHDGTVIAQLPDTSIHLVAEHDMELLPFTSLDPFIVTEDRRTIAVQQRADAPGAGVHLVTIRVP